MGSEAGGGGLRGCARVFAPAYWQEEDDERGGKWAGPASYSAGPVHWRQVSPFLSLSLYCFSNFCRFVLIWFANQIIFAASGNYCGCKKVYPRAPQNIPGSLEQ